MQHPRSDLHSKAKRLIAQEDFAAAIELLHRGFDDFGAHVLLLIDLAVAYLHLGDYQNFLKYTFLTHEELGSSKAKLSPGTRIKASHDLGILMKLAGHPSEALQLFENEINSSKIEKTSTKEMQAIRIQYLQLICEFNLKVNVAKQYLICEEISADEIQMEVQLQIALMEADYLLFGLQMAMSRVRQILKDHTIESSDRKTILFRFLSAVLRNNQASSLPFNFLNGINYFECTSYEKCLWDIYLSDLSETPFRTLKLSRAENLNSLEAIQFLYLLHQRENLEELAEASRKKLIYFLQALSPESQKFIMEQWPLKTSREARIIFIEESHLIIDGAKVELPAHSEIMMLLQLFANQRRLAVEQVLFHLYQMEYSSIGFDRLRMSVTRVNRTLEKTTSIKDLFVLNETALILNQFFSIQRRM